MIKKTDRGTIQIDMNAMRQWLTAKFIQLREYLTKVKDQKKRTSLTGLKKWKIPRSTTFDPSDSVLVEYNKWKNAPIPDDEFDASLSFDISFYNHPKINRREYERLLIKKRNEAHDNDDKKIMKSLKIDRNPQMAYPAAKHAYFKILKRWNGV